MATFKCEFPMRQAMLSIMEYRPLDGGWAAERVETARVPVLVWPIPTSEGLFMVEHQDGTAYTVRPESLTFLGSKELFDQYDWEEGDTSHSDRDRRAAAEVGGRSDAGIGGIA